MAFTIDQRKDEYFTYILEEGKKAYATWKDRGTSSKKIAARAKKYAYSKRLQADFFYRFRALIFLCALELRLKKRYAKFLKKLFLFFPFLRERSAFRLLKRMLGHTSEAQIRDLISVEMERFAMEVSKLKDVESADGGKTFFLNDTSILMELQSFFELCAEAEAQGIEPVDLLLEEMHAPMDPPEGNVSQSGVKREKLALDSLEKAQHQRTQKETIQEKTLEKGEKKGEEGKQVQDEKKTPEKKAEKLTPSTAIPSEIAAAFSEEVQEENSPFPIFREEKSDGKPLENKELRDGNESKDAQEKKDVAESVEKGASLESEKERSPFPVFRNGREEGAAKGVENPAEKGLKEDVSDTSAQAKKYLSYENQARIALRDSLSDAEKQAIAMRLQEMAAAHASVEEQKWLEENADRVGKENNRLSQAPPKDGFFLHNLKK